MDWNNLPGFLRTGYFYYNAKSDNEYLILFQWIGTAGTGIHADLQANARQDIIRVIIQKEGLKNFQPREKFIELKESNGDYNTAIDYALTDHDYLHWELNKDDPKQPQGSVIAPNGSTLTDLTQQLAVEDTKYQWDQFRAEVCRFYSSSCAWIIPALKGTRRFPTIKVTLSPSPNVEPEKTITGTVRIQLEDLEPKSQQNVRVFMTMNPSGKLSDEKKILFRGPAGDSGDYTLTLENDLPLTAPDKEGKITLTVSADYEDDPTVQSGTMRFYKADAEVNVGKGPVDKSIVLLIDKSGSMEGAKIQQARDAATQAVRKMGGATEVAVLAFSGGCSDMPVEYESFSQDPRTLESAIGRIQAGGGTPLVPAIAYTTDYIQRNHSGKSAEIILMTDGQNDCGSTSDATAAVRTSVIPITVTTIGFDIPKGSQADLDLQNISSSTGGKNYNAQDAKQLTHAFSRTMLMNVIKQNDAGQGQPQSYFDRGKQLLQNDDFPSALFQYQQAFKVAPSSPAVNFNLSIVYEEVDQLTPAIDHAQRYLNLAPNAFDRGVVTARIESMRQELARNPRELLDPGACRDVYQWAKSTGEAAKKSKNPAQKALLFNILIAAQKGDCANAREQQRKYMATYP